MTSDRFETVRRLLVRGVRAGTAPGMVAAWQATADPSPRTIAVGRARVQPSSEGTTPGTWFDLASLTKPLVVGTLTLLTMRDGALSPMTVVEEILPETSGSPVGSRSVSRLLSHSSGLPAWEPVYALAGGNRERALDALIGLTVGEPDAHVVYSCPGFILLGMMLERLTDTSLDVLFSDHVIRPLGLKDEIGYRPNQTRVVASGAPTPNTEKLLLKERGLSPDLIPMVNPREPDDGNSRFLGCVAGNAGLFGTANGILALAQVYLGAGGFLTATEIRMATADRTRGLEQARGFGWQLASSPGCSAGPALDRSAFGHTGFTGTSLWIDPTKGIALTLLTNRVHPGHRAADLHP